MTAADIKPGQTYSGKRWKGAREVVRFVHVKNSIVVHYLDLRTSRTGNAPLELFAANADHQSPAPLLRRYSADCSNCQSSSSSVLTHAHLGM